MPIDRSNCVSFERKGFPALWRLGDRTPSNITEFSADYIGDADNFYIRYSLRNDNVESQLQKLLKEAPDRVVSMKTAEQEEYKCVLPTIERVTQQQQILEYKGLGPAELIKPLADEKVMSSYGGSGYWFYDFSHGKYILQYHDNRETKERTEYSLGTYRADQSEEDAKKFDQLKPPKTKIRDVDYPYYPVHYRHGTACDLTNRPRETTVMYVCYEFTKHMIHAITEVSTCNYELIVLTNLLCTHPAFQAPTTPEHEIHCYASPDAAYAKPVQLRDLEKKVLVENFDQYSNSKDSSTAPSRSAAFDKLVAAANTYQQFQERATKFSDSKPPQNIPQQDKAPVSEKTDTSEKSDWEKQQQEGLEQEDMKRLIKIYLRIEDENESLYRIIKDFEFDRTAEEREVSIDFFTQKNCFVGGQGYWKYEFCYRKKITQYHIENGKRTREIVLGVWNTDEHDRWFKANRKKAVVVNREALIQVSNYYSDGDYCEESGDKRFVETRLKCRIPELGESLDLVLLYIQEPSPCQYVLYLESYLICEALQTLTPQGLVIDPDNTSSKDQYLEEINEVRAKRDKEWEELRVKDITKKAAGKKTKFVISTEFSADYIGDIDSFHIIYNLRNGNVELELQQLLKEAPDRVISMKTAAQEEYECILPVIERATQEQQILDYKGPSPAELIKPLADEKIISSYGGSGYWFYALAHGKYILQYHEEREQKERIEHSLGTYRADQNEENAKNFNQLDPPKTKIRDIDHPYYPVYYRHGTVCEVTNKPRETTVIYVCDEVSRAVIYSVNEVTSCNYEIIVLTNLLCAHPAFQAPTTPEHKIHCYASPDAAHAKPENFRELERQVNAEKNDHYALSSGSYKHSYLDEFPSRGHGPIQPSDPPYDKSAPLTGRDDSVNSMYHDSMLKVKKAQETPVWKMIKRMDDLMSNDNYEMVADFWDGKTCFISEHGYWQYEFCYGNKIVQFHIEGNKRTREIVLGEWNEASHILWFQSHRDRAFVLNGNDVVQVSHYYTNGDFCDEIRNTRSVEVRIKCREPPESEHPTTVFLTVDETTTCRYILTLQAGMFCEGLQEMEKIDGLMPSVEFSEQEKLLEQLAVKLGFTQSESGWEKCGTYRLVITF
ncbi:hypothetical protein FO519_004556 [Halicephalobus sp. NKZ332]|nr:hypothetical protein FO519_004556 [Halicephalobus sp. NKZ332]